MKIGILTFHWATNYGAVLQSYALQITLERMGHHVEIINYKPSQFDDSFYNFIVQHKFLHFKSYIQNRKKEKYIQKFRSKYLNVTVRFDSQKTLKKNIGNYDILITGSDQVLNSYFLQYGENGGSFVYFLGFENISFKKVAYAVSFGTTDYPIELCKRVCKYVKQFDAISVRESSGIDIFEKMGNSKACIVPDPTLLLNQIDYDEIVRKVKVENNSIFVYMLHNRCDFINKLKLMNIYKDCLFSKNEPIEQWIDNIRSSNGMITNSFHGVVFCLKYHIPFVVVLQQLENVGMNDRFYTLLGKCGLLDRLSTEDEFSSDLFKKEIFWNNVDCHLKIFINEGLSFLYNYIK